MGMILCFLDLETTGLDPTRCEILEVACVLAKEDLVPFARFERVIRDESDPFTHGWEHVAYLMHRQSGLLEECRGSTTDLTAAGLALHDFLAEHLGKNLANLAGNSVHFDRGFVAVHWPRILHFFSHRHLDVSALRIAAELRGKPRWEGETAHRAMADCESSIEQLRYYQGLGA